LLFYASGVLGTREPETRVVGFPVLTGRKANHRLETNATRLRELPTDGGGAYCPDEGSDVFAP